MKLRTPTISFETGPDSAIGGHEPAPGAAEQGYPVLKFEAPTERRYRVRLITPMYGGGREAAMPEPERPIRATEILYGLRFWWRLGQLKQLRDAGVPRNVLHQRLFKRERELWGGPAIGRDAWPCQVRLRVDLVPGEDGRSQARTQPCVAYSNPYRKQNGRWGWKKHLIGPGYAIFPGVNKEPSEPDRNNSPFWRSASDKPHEVICSGLEFELSIRSDVSDRAGEVEEAIRAWVCFGGLGARTRRGLGALEAWEVSDASAVDEGRKYLEPFDEDEALKLYGCVLIPKPTVSSAQAAWEMAVNALAEFCQHHGRLARNGPRGRSFWPEGDSIRNIASHHFVDSRDPAHEHSPRAECVVFPRAAFGLPRNFRFAPGQGAQEDWSTYHNKDPKPTSLVPLDDHHDRLASPLILKPMRTANGYVPIALLLPTDHLLGLSVELKKGSNKVTGYDQQLPKKKSTPDSGASGNAWWPADWSQQIAAAKQIPSKAMTQSSAATQSSQTYRNGDESILLPLAAFLDYFKDPESFK